VRKTCWLSELHGPLSHTSVHVCVLQVGIIMGSDSDLPTMKAAEDILQEFGVPCELTIVSAHRTPDRMMTYARTAHERGLQVSQHLLH
jgi:phosphoribosylaminoimidazole carboxylase